MVQANCVDSVDTRNSTDSQARAGLKYENVLRATAIDTNVTVRVRTYHRENRKCYVTRLGTPREARRKKLCYKREARRKKARL